MQITVNAPERRLPEYLRLVAQQIEEGYSSGHVDAGTNWETTERYDQADPHDDDGNRVTPEWTPPTGPGSSPFKRQGH